MSAELSAPPQPELLQRKIQSLTVELLSVYEELALLFSLGAQIGRLSDERQIGAVALREAMDISNADCGWLAFCENGALEIPESCRNGLSSRTAADITRRLLADLLRRGKFEFLSRSLRLEHGFSQHDAPARFLACSIVHDGHCYGFLCLGRAAGRSVFLSPDQKLIRALALLVAVQFENTRLQRSEREKQRLLDELEMARSIQQSLSPGILPQVSFLQSACSSEPCYQIGGDFYDLFPIDDTRCLLLIADVCGKGPSAALQAAMAQGVIQTIAQTRPCLSCIVHRLNDILFRRSSGKSFLSLFAAFLASDGRLDYVNAGHPPALWIRGPRHVAALARTGSLLGILPRPQFTTAAVQLRPNDLLMLYTDGITEAENERGEAFGVRRLLSWAANQYARPCPQIRQDLLSALAAFCGKRQQVDDKSLLIVRYR